MGWSASNGPVLQHSRIETHPISPRDRLATVSIAQAPRPSLMLLYIHHIRHHPHFPSHLDTTCAHPVCGNNPNSDEFSLSLLTPLAHTLCHSLSISAADRLTHAPELARGTTCVKGNLTTSHAPQDSLRIINLHLANVDARVSVSPTDTTRSNLRPIREDSNVTQMTLRLAAGARQGRRVLQLSTGRMAGGFSSEGSLVDRGGSQGRKDSAGLSNARASQPPVNGHPYFAPCLLSHTSL